MKEKYPDAEISVELHHDRQKGPLSEAGFREIIADAFKEVLNDPDKMPRDCTFEALLYIPSEAYQRKTGRKYAYTPAFSFETFSNQAGWASL